MYNITIRMFCAASAVIMVLLQGVYAENPVVQTNFTPDPAPMVYNDTVFLYTGHDEDYCSQPNTPQFCMENYLLYTSTDLVNWTDHGVIASLKSFSWAPNNGAWAAQCVHRDGKFYYYVSIHGKGIGVLVADSPYGPFTDPLGKPLFYHSWYDIDPTVFVDDDGQAYMYWGNPECYWAKLNNDMISISGKIDSLVPRMRTYQEGPWFYKRNNHYYLAWSSTCCPEGIGYAMSDKPTGPWTYKNSIMDGNQLSPGNQPGIFDYKGKSYTFGFNFSINHSQVTQHSERRSACLAEMPYNEDGTIPKLPWFGDRVPEPGVKPVGTLNPYDTVQAETICFAKGVRTMVCNDISGKMCVDSIHNGDYIKVRCLDFKTGASRFDARVASATNGGKIEIRLDSLTGPIVGTCTVNGTGGWQNWQSVSCEVDAVKDTHDIFFRFTGEYGMLFNFNWWKFSLDETAIAQIKKQAGEKGACAVNCYGRNLCLDLPATYVQKWISVHLFDAVGRKVAVLFDATGEASRLSMSLPAEKIPAGGYVVSVTVDNRVAATRKVMVR